LPGERGEGFEGVVVGHCEAGRRKKMVKKINE
jgi:hypothetical protein